MKKNILALTAFLALGTALFTGCNQEDTTPPVITLTGSNPLNLEMRKTYVEPGFTADDDKDGNLTSSVVVDKTDLDNNLPADYTIYYSVTDAAGNIGNAERTVTVYATNTALAANYQVHDDCGGGVTYDYAQTVAASGTVKITFNKFADYSGNTGIYANVDTNGDITLPLQQANGIGSLSENHTFQGTGHVTATGFSLTYTDTNLSQGNASATCVGTWTRQ